MERKKMNGTQDENRSSSQKHIQRGKQTKCFSLKYMNSYLVSSVSDCARANAMFCCLLLENLFQRSERVDLAEHLTGYITLQSRTLRFDFSFGAFHRCLACQVDILSVPILLSLSKFNFSFLFHTFVCAFENAKNSVHAIHLGRDSECTCFSPISRQTKELEILSQHISIARHIFRCISVRPRITIRISRLLECNEN